jgi:hypothetical protein
VHAAPTLNVGAPLQSESLLLLQPEGQQRSPPLHAVTPVHDCGQSMSLAAVQPAAQQPSPVTQTRIFCCVQLTLQPSRLPLMIPMVHRSPSSQLVGQLPSQVSPGSTMLLPQLAEQSESFALVQPGAQQPSPLLQAPG